MWIASDSPIGNWIDGFCWKVDLAIYFSFVFHPNVVVKSQVCAKFFKNKLVFSVVSGKNPIMKNKEICKIIKHIKIDSNFNWENISIKVMRSSYLIVEKDKANVQNTGFFLW